MDLAEEFDRGSISIVKSRKRLDIRVPSVPSNDTEEKNDG